MFQLRKMIKDYEIREVAGKDGTVKKVPVYIGPQFVRTADEDMARRLKRIYAAAAVLLLVLFALCGTLDNAGNRNLVNALAYALSCFPILYNFIGMVAALRLGERAERREYEAAICRMRRSAVGIMVFYGLAFVSEIAALFLTDRTVRPLTECFYLLLVAVIFAAAWLIRYLCRRYPYITETDGENKHKQ